MRAGWSRRSEKSNEKSQNPMPHRHHLLSMWDLSFANVIPIRIKNDNCVASPCRAAALSAASRLVLLSNANWNYLSALNRGAAMAAHHLRHKWLAAGLVRGRDGAGLPEVVAAGRGEAVHPAPRSAGTAGATVCDAACIAASKSGLTRSENVRSPMPTLSPHAVQASSGTKAWPQVWCIKR